MNNSSVLTLLISTSICLVAHAGDSAKNADVSSVSNEIKPSYPSPEWSIKIGPRYARTAFKGSDKNVTGILPKFYYEGEHFFIRGTEGGIHLWGNDTFGFDALTRYRFFDYPEKHENKLDRNTFDGGLRAYWNIEENTQLSAEILSDSKGRMHGILKAQRHYGGKRWQVSPSLELRIKGSDFNTRYYGLDMDHVNAGVDARAAILSRWHLWRNFHLEASAEARWLDANARGSTMIDESMEYMAYIGFGLFEKPLKSYTKTNTKTLNAKPFIRVAQGSGNDSSLAEIFAGDIRKDGAKVNMTSIFYGHPLTDRVLNLPIEFYLTPGIIHHYSSSAQGNGTEFVLGFKFFYTIPTPWRVRLGAAEGVSYVDSVTYYENKSLTRDGLIPSKLLNYVDLSVDFNIGDIIGTFSETTLFDDLWLGTAIHHRSGIGGSSPTFGNIKGGSNFNTITLQWSGKF